MKILVVGSGGREHALSWKLARSERVKEVFVSPGNPGIALEPKVVCTGEFGYSQMVSLCKEKGISFVVVGPDQALADGLVDLMQEAGILAFGPTKAAAAVESSKIFSKELMKAREIPTARYKVFTSFLEAKKFLENVSWGSGWVVKADGLALGKGVVVAESREEALLVAEEFLSGKRGDAGKRIVVEERLSGREVSGFYLCDGFKAVLIGFACDYKRIFDGDRGPNTGGMGAYSPADWLPPDTDQRVRSEIVLPLLEEMRKRGAAYKGVLFVGLMITTEGPKVIEFNARFGDPETQALLPLLDEDLLPWLEAAAKGELHAMLNEEIRKKDLSAVHVVMAAAGYPGSSGEQIRKGDKIGVPPELFPEEEGEERRVKLFFAGVARQGTPPVFITSGGRVMGLTAMADSRANARRLVYSIAESIFFPGMQKRSDVGASP